MCKQHSGYGKFDAPARLFTETGDINVIPTIYTFWPPLLRKMSRADSSVDSSLNGEAP